MTTEPTALYRVFGDDGLLLYIGISNNFGNRWKRHAKVQPWWDEKRRLTVDEWFDSRREAEATETTATKAEKPKYNKTHGTCPPRPRRGDTGPATTATPPPSRSWIEGASGIGWAAPLPPRSLENPERTATMCSVYRGGCSGIGYA